MTRPRLRRHGLLLIASALFLAACSSGGSDTAATTTTEPGDSDAVTTTTAPRPEGSLDEVTLDTLEVAELRRPTAMASRPSSPDLYVTEQSGAVRVIKVTEPTSGTGPTRYQLQSTPVLDLTKEVEASGTEQGLLGLAFSSDGRKLYVDFTARPDGRTKVVEYVLGERATVDASSRRELLVVDQPAPNHNGGQLAIGPDGYLYVGLGDGGGSGDPSGRAQDREDLLGAILRIDPEGRGADGEPAYGIPAGNPYADGEDGAPEIWLYGVRNPWRFSFDAQTGDLWIGDVGQNQWEEVDRLPAVGGFDAGRGANLGWDRLEGSHPFEGDNPPGGVLPFYEYSHDDGCSVTGGFVYRGSAIEALQGTYLFSDYCAGGITGLQVDDGALIDERGWLPEVTGVLSFGEDNDGELFVLLEAGSVHKLIIPSTTR